VVYLPFHFILLRSTKLTMKPSQFKDAWAAGALYEPYVGRWSRLVARELLEWLSIPVQKDWLDVGCGTGALSQIIFEHALPNAIKGIDSSTDFVTYAKAHVGSARVTFEVRDIQALQIDSASFDVVVSGLVLNFVLEPRRAVAEMARVARPGGAIAAYVWDYPEKMELMRYFWDAAVALDPVALEFDEGRRFPICQPFPLAELFKNAGLQEVEVQPIDIPTHFRDFDDYWSPFLGGQGPAPGYAMSLSEARREALRERIRSNLPIAADGSIPLTARAWAVRGRAT
jgi:SAM-dependent methyltransferase